MKHIQDLSAIAPSRVWFLAESACNSFEEVPGSSWKPLPRWLNCSLESIIAGRAGQIKKLQEALQAPETEADIKQADELKKKAKLAELKKYQAESKVILLVDPAAKKEIRGKLKNFRLRTLVVSKATKNQLCLEVEVETNPRLSVAGGPLRYLRCMQYGTSEG